MDKFFVYMSEFYFRFVMATKDEKLDDLVVIETIYRCKLCAEAFPSKEAIFSHVKQGCEGQEVEKNKTSPTASTKKKRQKIKTEPESDDEDCKPVECKEDEETPSRRPSRKRKLTEKMKAFSKDNEKIKFTSDKPEQKVTKLVTSGSVSPRSTRSHNEFKLIKVGLDKASEKVKKSPTKIERKKNVDENIVSKTSENNSNDKSVEVETAELLKEAEKVLDAVDEEMPAVVDLQRVLTSVEGRENNQESENVTSGEEILIKDNTAGEVINELLEPLSDNINSEAEKSVTLVDLEDSIPLINTLPQSEKTKEAKSRKSYIKKEITEGECPMCPHRFNTAFECLLHLETTHSRYVMVKDGKETSIKTIQYAVEQAMAHLAEEDEEGDKIVEKQEKDEDELDEDVENVIKVEKPELNMKKGCMKCPVCCKPFRACHMYRHLLRIHIMKYFKPKVRKVVKPTPTLCDVCGKGFKYAQNMKIHKMKVHLGIPHPYRKPPSERPKLTFTCEICGYMACEKRRLNYHIMAFHENKIPFKCQHCDYQTWERTAHRDHSYRHQKDKPHKCEFCNYQCIQKPMLRAHLLRHHGVILPKSTHSNKPRWKELEEDRIKMEAEKAGISVEEAIAVKQEGKGEPIEMNGKLTDQGIHIIQSGNDQEEQVVVSHVQSSTVEAIDSLLQMHADLSLHSYSQSKPNEAVEETEENVLKAGDGGTFEIIQEDTVNAETDEAQETVTLEPVHTVVEGEDSSKIFLTTQDESNTDGSQSPLKVYVSSNNKEGLSMQDLQNVCLQLGESLGMYGGREIVLVMSEPENST